MTKQKKSAELFSLKNYGKSCVVVHKRASSSSRSHPLCQSSLNARNEIVSNLVIGAEFLQNPSCKAFLFKNKPRK